MNYWNKNKAMENIILNEMIIYVNNCLFLFLLPHPQAETVFEDEDYDNIFDLTPSSNTDRNHNSNQSFSKGNNVYSSSNSSYKQHKKQHIKADESTSLPLLTMIGLNLNGGPFSALTSSMWPQDLILVCPREVLKLESFG